MADILTFADRSGSVIFDFEQKKMIYERGGGIADSLGFVSLEVNMEDITAIELRPPKITKLAGFSLIINNTRYITRKGHYATEFIIVKKSEFSTIQSALERVAQIAGISEIKGENEVNVPKEVYKSTQDEDIIYTFTNNLNSTIKIYPDYITIKHSGALNFLTKGGLKGEKRIDYMSISSVECRKATTMAAGFLQFSIMGTGSAGGLSSATEDENSIIFDAGKNNIVQQIVDYVEKRRHELIAKPAQQVVQAASSADEIIKFKQLLDSGIITQEEFDAKKKQLLGL